MIYKVHFIQRSKGHIERLKRSEPGAYEKFKALLKELEQHPRTGLGKPKPLKGNHSGSWSRRIDSKHRLVYRIDDEVVVVLVLSAIGHYDDK